MNFSVMSSTSGNDDQALTTSCTKQKNLSSNLKSKFKVDLHVPANLFKEIVKTNVIQNWKKNNFCNKHFHLDFHVSYHKLYISICLLSTMIFREEILITWAFWSGKSHFCLLQPVQKSFPISPEILFQECLFTFCM